MSFFKSKRPPIDDDARKWVEESGRYIFRLFGLKYLKSKPFIYPDRIFSDLKYNVTETDSDYLAFQICQVMDISPRSIETEYISEDPHVKVLRKFPFAPTSYTSAAGTFNDTSDIFKETFKISLKRTLLKQPEKLLAVIIHELSHVKLLGEHRMSEDDEELTDLLSVFFGLGIFSANAVMPYTSLGGVGKLGYLTPAIYGYTLALWVLYKNDDEKKVLPFLSPAVKDVFKKTIRYIRDNNVSYWTSFKTPGNLKIIKIGNPPKKIGGF